MVSHVILFSSLLPKPHIAVSQLGPMDLPQLFWGVIVTQ
jgi:hypothetical protein